MVHLFALGFSDSSFSIPKESGITDLFRIALALWDFYISIFIFDFCEECHGLHLDSTCFGCDGHLHKINLPLHWHGTNFHILVSLSIILSRDLNSHCIGLSLPLTCFP